MSENLLFCTWISAWNGCQFWPTTLSCSHSLYNPHCPWCTGLSPNGIIQCLGLPEEPSQRARTLGKLLQLARPCLNLIEDLTKIYIWIIYFFNQVIRYGIFFPMLNFIILDLTHPPAWQDLCGCHHLIHLLWLQIMSSTNLISVISMSSSKLLMETFNDTGHSLCLLQPTPDIDQLLVRDLLAIGVHPLTNTPNFTSSIQPKFLHHSNKAITRAL